jgi:hypothetical protein
MPEQWERPCLNQKVQVKVRGERGAHKRRHFHIKGVGWAVSVDLDTFEVIRGTDKIDTAEFNEAMAVVRLHIDALRNRWRERNEIE